MTEETQTNEEEPVREWPEVCPNKTPEELEKFILEVCDKKIFTSAHCPDDITFVFMCAGLGAYSGAPDSYLRSIGILYEYVDKASLLDTNGFPVFFSHLELSVSDWEKAHDKIRGILQKREDEETRIEEELRG